MQRLVSKSNCILFSFMIFIYNCKDEEYRFKTLLEAMINLFFKSVLFMVSMSYWPPQSTTANTCWVSFYWLFKSLTFLKTGCSHVLSLLFNYFIGKGILVVETLLPSPLLKHRLEKYHSVYITPIHISIQEVYAPRES